MNAAVKMGRAIVVAFLAVHAAISVAADAYPSRPIRMVIPFPPGGTTDVIGRYIAQQIGEELGQSVVVDNRGGASGDIGAKAVATSAPDGYTLLFVPMGTMAINPNLAKAPAFDPAKDFTPIIKVFDANVIVLVGASVPVNSLQEFVALAKGKPGVLNYGTPGPGTAPHLAAEIFKSVAQVDIVHVPYKGGGPALAGLLGGDVAVMFTFVPSASAHIKAGKARALAVASAKRSLALPDVPTTTELGMAGYQMTEWYALFGPAGMPEATVRTLNEAVGKVLAKPAVIKYLTDLGVDPGGGSSAQLGSLVTSDLARFARVVQQTGLKAE